MAKNQTEEERLIKIDFRALAEDAGYQVQALEILKGGPQKSTPWEIPEELLSHAKDLRQFWRAKATMYGHTMEAV